MLLGVSMREMTVCQKDSVSGLLLRKVKMSTLARMVLLDLCYITTSRAFFVYFWKALE